MFKRISKMGRDRIMPILTELMFEENTDEPWANIVLSFFYHRRTAISHNIETMALSWCHHSVNMMATWNSVFSKNCYMMFIILIYRYWRWHDVFALHFHYFSSTVGCFAWCTIHMFADFSLFSVYFGSYFFVSVPFSLFRFLFLCFGSIETLKHAVLILIRNNRNKHLVSDSMKLVSVPVSVVSNQNYSSFVGHPTCE
jgi:hypothetical protein